MQAETCLTIPLVQMTKKLETCILENVQQKRKTYQFLESLHYHRGSNSEICASLTELACCDVDVLPIFPSLFTEKAVFVGIATASVLDLSIE